MRADVIQSKKKNPENRTVRAGEFRKTVGIFRVHGLSSSSVYRAGEGPDCRGGSAVLRRAFITVYTAVIIITLQQFYMGTDLPSSPGRTCQAGTPDCRDRGASFLRGSSPAAYGARDR